MTQSTNLTIGTLAPSIPKASGHSTASAETPKWIRKYFYNPPYNNVVPWLRNSIRDWENSVLSCALIKADTSTSWMHDLVFPYARVIWVRGRLEFSDRGSAPFNSAAAVYEPGKIRPKQSVMWKDRSGVAHPP